MLRAIDRRSATEHMADQDSGLTALVERHRAELQRFLVARTGDRDEAEDILQDLWLRVRNVESGPVSNGRAYLFRIANNLVLDRVRERSRRSARDSAWHGEAFGPEDDPADARADAEGQLLAREEAARLASAIGNLPEGARRALRLHKIDGLSHSEVAARLGISRSGVEKHIAVAMKHLRAALGD
jgi:RNA polymerase sigma-70 factor (ECF subfamily)